jgi:hypothetical protein
MRLEILNSGHRLKWKAMFAVMRVVSRARVPDVVKTLTYRPEFLGNHLNEGSRRRCAGRRSGRWQSGR